MLNLRKSIVLALAAACLAGSAQLAQGSVFQELIDIIGEGGSGTKHLMIFNETGRKIRLDVSSSGNVYLNPDQDFWTTHYEKTYYVKMFVWNSNTKRWVRKATGTYGAGARVTAYKSGRNEFAMKVFYPR